MQDVHGRFPDDMDVATLYVEALMDLHPWDLWTPDGQEQPWTPEIVSSLEKILERAPDQPGANHYYIHAVEASPHPEKAKAAAERVARLMPGAAHMVHMPSHLWHRLGDYEASSQANRQAIEVDNKYVAQTHPQGFYTMYVAHNYQFLMASAMMEGRSAEAIDNARLTLQHAPVEMLRQMPGFDLILPYPSMVLARFERWDEVLKEPAPPADFNFANAIWHSARGLAYTANPAGACCHCRLRRCADCGHCAIHRPKLCGVWGVSAAQFQCRICHVFGAASHARHVVSGL